MYLTLLSEIKKIRNFKIRPSMELKLLLESAKILSIWNEYKRQVSMKYFQKQYRFNMK